MQLLSHPALLSAYAADRAAELQSVARGTHGRSDGRHARPSRRVPARRAPAWPRASVR